MSLLDQIIGGLTGGNTANASPMQGVLMSLLAGSQQGGMSGGLGAIINSFQQAGLGHIAQSWVSNGPNQPVSPQQLQSVLGQDQVQNMASQAGMEPHDFLSQLSQHLPNAVDGMTPNGRLPDEGSASV